MEVDGPKGQMPESVSAQVHHGPVASSLQGAAQNKHPFTPKVNYSQLAYPFGLWEKAGDVNSRQKSPLPQGDSNLGHLFRRQCQPLDHRAPVNVT